MRSYTRRSIIAAGAILPFLPLASQAGSARMPVHPRLSGNGRICIQQAYERMQLLPCMASSDCIFKDSCGLRLLAKAAAASPRQEG
jgi:hypothetical protein